MSVFRNGNWRKAGNDHCRVSHSLESTRQDAVPGEHVPGSEFKAGMALAPFFVFRAKVVFRLKEQNVLP